MLSIKLLKQNKYFTGLLISGHALMNRPGEDIVCASVSILGFTLVNYLTDISNIDKNDLNLYAIENVEASLLSINIEEENIYTKDIVQNGFNFFEIGIISLLDEYNDYVELIYREV